MGGNTEIGAERPARPGAPVIRLPRLEPDGGRDHLPRPAAGPGLGLKEARRLAKAAAASSPAPG